MRSIDAPKYAFTHRNLPESEKLSELFKMYMKVSILLYKHHAIIESRAAPFDGDSRVSQVQPRINAHEILLQHDWLLFFSRHNRLAETLSYLQLSYQITDRLLAAGNAGNIISLIQI